MESLFFLKLILCIKLLIIGNLFEMSLNLVCNLFRVCLWLVRCSLVSIAIAICSLTSLSELSKTKQLLSTGNYEFQETTYLCTCAFSFKYMSLRLFMPSVLKLSELEPCKRSSLSRRAECCEQVFLKSLDKSARMSLWRCNVCNIAAPETGCSAMRSFSWLNCKFE